MQLYKMPGALYRAIVRYPGGREIDRSGGVEPAEDGRPRSLDPVR